PFLDCLQHNRLAVKEELNVIHAENQHEEIGNALTSRERPYMSSLGLHPHYAIRSPPTILVRC
ncbi:MAG: hypothetical protein ACI9LX_002620, partial [Paraglaciecola sp.]